MTVISRRIMVPIVGKTELAHERAKKLAAIMTKAGAGVRVLKVIMGEDAGNIEIFSRFADFTEGTRASVAIQSDPDFKALMVEREKNTAAIASGPYVYRLVFGEVSVQPVLLQREYQIDRKNLKHALDLLPEVKSAYDPNSGLSAAVPTFSAEMDRLIITYYANSIDHMGENIDKYGLSQAFQDVVMKASEYGKLVSARALAVI
jgi:hypothetical protein